MPEPATVEIDGQAATVHSFAIPLRYHVRGVQVREGLLLNRDGIWSEWSPPADLDDAAAARWLGVSLEQGSPQAYRASIPLSVTVPAIAPQDAAQLVRESSCVTATVVVADENQADDLARVAAVREALGAKGRLRVDAAGAWTVEQAVQQLADLAEFNLEFVEQPVADAEQLRQLRAELAERGLQIAIAADEMINATPDFDAQQIASLVDFAVLKVHPLGGVAKTVEVAEQLGVPCVISSTCETSIGLHAGVRAAACLPTLRYSNELDTARLLSSDVIARPLASQYGAVRVAGRPWADLELLAQNRADQQQEQWWLDRLQRCLALL